MAVKILLLCSKIAKYQKECHRFYHQNYYSLNLMKFLLKYLKNKMKKKRLSLLVQFYKLLKANKHFVKANKI
jgi:hypothetical protein